jgi:hypothetical protein
LPLKNNLEIIADARLGDKFAGEDVCENASAIELSTKSSPHANTPLVAIAT